MYIIFLILLSVAIIYYLLKQRDHETNKSDALSAGDNIRTLNRYTLFAYQNSWMSSRKLMRTWRNHVGDKSAEFIMIHEFLENNYVTADTVVPADLALELDIDIESVLDILDNSELVVRDE